MPASHRVVRVGEIDQLRIHLGGLGEPLGGADEIRNNNIGLLETTTGFGGEFFVSGNATVECNTIVSEGDRYIDLDPDPNAASRPTIRNNWITVIIKQGAGDTQGTLLELRSRDYDCNTNGCESGAYPLADSIGYDVGTNAWALQKLEILTDCKVNLTNRQGFEYDVTSNGEPETVAWFVQLSITPHSFGTWPVQLSGAKRLPNRRSSWLRCWK